MLALFKQYLQSKSITPSDDEEVITFNYKDLNYIFSAEKSDPNYFRLIIPNLYKAKNDEDRLKYGKAANNINMKYKVVKAVVMDDDMLWVSVEQFVYSMDNIERLFERSMALLGLIVEQLRDELKDVAK